MQTKTDDRVHVVISAAAARKLDQVVAQALNTGERPGGRRPCRGSILEVLIDAATAQQTPCAGESEGR